MNTLYDEAKEHPEQFLTVEEYNAIFNKNKGKNMTNDTLSTKMAEALAIAERERTDHAHTPVETDPPVEDKETTFIQTDEDVGDRAPIQV